jgi:hypothetical protein
MWAFMIKIHIPIISYMYEYSIKYTFASNTK